jgi:hypothetical protein
MKFLEDTLHAGQDGTCDISQILARFHDVQIEIGLNFKQAKNLIQHFAVLGGDAHPCLYTLRASQRMNERGHFYGFWASAEYRENFHCGQVLCRRTAMVGK